MVQGIVLPSGEELIRALPDLDRPSLLAEAQQLARIGSSHPDGFPDGDPCIGDCQSDSGWHLEDGSSQVRGAGKIHPTGRSHLDLDIAADVTLRVSLATLNKLYRKETNAMTAVMMGKIKIEGNMMLAMQLEKVLS